MLLSKNEIIEADLRNGYTRVPNHILDALPQVGMNGTQHDICHILLRETYGWNRTERAISVGEMAQITHLSKRHIINQLDELARRHIIVRHAQPGKANIYKIQSDVSRWIDYRRQEGDETDRFQSAWLSGELYLLEDRRDMDPREPGIVPAVIQTIEGKTIPATGGSVVQLMESTGVNNSGRGGLNKTSEAGMNNGSGVCAGPVQTDWASETTLKKDLKKVKDNPYRYTSKSTAYKLASLLLENLRDCLPGFMEPDMQEWSKIIDDMIKVEKRHWVDISDVIEFAVNDGFWRKVIFSPSDLRKHFDRMRGIMYSERNLEERRWEEKRDAEMARSILAEDTYRDSHPDGSEGTTARRSRYGDWDYESDEYKKFFR